MTDQGRTTVADQAAAAVADAHRVATRFANLVGMVARGEVAPWMNRIEDAVIDDQGKRGCKHIRRTPIQPLNVLAWAPDVVLCTTCVRNRSLVTALVADRTRALPDGRMISPTDLCTACDAHHPGMTNLSEVIMRAEAFLIWCLLCPDCLTTIPAGEPDPT